MKTMTVLGWVAKAIAIGALQLACAVQSGTDVAGATGGAGGEDPAGEDPSGLGGEGGEAPDCAEGDYACELSCAEGDWFCEGRAQQGCAYEDREWTCVGGGADGDCVWQSSCPK